ncbi:MAG TPA: M57 family metalloprotease [Ohtaekwangia sp.]|uniref:M57 family metalloprotease n=1 Tax=Ohtaekwangia sp. TaxID=2066019 RepID=UPI002F95E5B6
MNVFFKVPLRGIRLLSCVVAIAILLCTSCENEKISSDESTAQQELNVVASKLQAAGFDTSEGFQKYENGYLVEYDIFLTPEMINELAESATTPANGRTEHYRSNNLVVATPRTLQVYIDAGFGTYMQNSFDAALARYNAQGLGLTFQRASSSASADISIFSFYEVSNVLGYSAGFPTNGNPASPIRLNTYYYNNTSTRPDATTVIAHEIGHAIGFRHTDYMNRTFSCGSGGNEGDAGVGANYIPGTPTGPSAGSWMLACSSNTDRPFTSDDVTALTTVYPNRTIPAGTSPVYRYYSGSSGDHFYTTNWGELGSGKDGYVLEGITLYANTSQASGTVPVYRYYSGSSSDHFYTTNWGELGAGGSGYTYEGVAFYAFTSQVSGTVPVYRYYSGSSGDHFYTTNWGELGAGGSGYTYEGIGFYGYP